jgi:hypothetical protein
MMGMNNFELNEQAIALTDTTTHYQLAKSLIQAKMLLSELIYTSYGKGCGEVDWDFIERVQDFMEAKE